MNRARPHPLLALLTLFYASSTGIALAGQRMDDHESATDGAERAIVAQAVDYAELRPNELAQAEQLVSRIYEEIGVRIVWLHGRVSPEDPRGLVVFVRLLSREMAERKISKERIKSNVLGQANRPSRLVYVFFHRILPVAVRHEQDYARLLGLVIAHELGHVMLPADSHSPTGIMSARADVWSRAVRYFTVEQGAAIRSFLTRATEAPSAATRPPNPEPNVNTNEEARSPEA